MKRNCALIRAFIVVLIFWGTAGRSAAEIEVITPAEVAPGDRGVCITEVEEGRLVEIPISIIGVVGANQPEGEMVLIRLEDARFEATGVAAGMSGSPVMVRGRLLGALAFGWAFASEPIAGVTPFERMKGIASDVRGGGFEAGSTQLPLPELLEAQNEGRLAKAVLDWLVPRETDAQRELPLVVAAGGPAWATGHRGWAEAVWQRMGWVTAPGGGKVAGGRSAGTLQPGSMIAGILVRGDASLAAGGTVTAIDGDAVWAFGHPFLGAGDLIMPLTRASVVTILPSLANSFKVFNVGETIGTLRSDRRHGVWGTMGPGPEMLPVVIQAGRHSYSFEVLRHPVLTPLLTGILVSASHQVRGRVFGMQTVTIHLELELARGEPLILDQVFDGVDAPSEASAWASAVVAYLETSPFASDDIQGLNITLDSANALKRAAVLDITPDRWIVEPGDRLGIRVRLQRPGEAVRSLRMEVEVPAGVADGRLDLVVADGATWTAYDLQARPFRPAGFEDEITILKRLESSGELVAALEVPGTALVLAGGTVAAPAGLVASLRSGLGSGLPTAKYRVASRTMKDAEGPVAAAVRLRLMVKTRSGLMGDD